MNFINEKDGLVVLGHLLHHGLEAFFEITAIAGSGQQRPHIEGIDPGIRQHFGNLGIIDLFRQAFSNRCFANTAVTDKKRVVLGPAAQHLNGPVNLGLTTDERVNPAFAGLDVQINGIGGERILFLGSLLGTALNTLGGSGFSVEGRVLGDTVADIGDSIKTGHLLLLQGPDSVALTFGEKRDQDIGPCRHFPPRGLGMDDGALQNTLEPGRWLNIAANTADGGQCFLKMAFQLPAQGININVAGGQHFERVTVFGQGNQQMLKRSKFMPLGFGKAHGTAEGFFQFLREHRYYSFSI